MTPSSSSNPLSLVAHAQSLIAKVICAGDLVIDATVGNGYDTLFLSQCVGPQGRVLGFDVQSLAIKKTRNLLNKHKSLGNTTLSQCCHSQLAGPYSENSSKKISAAMFNLGFLPGSDKTIITQSNTTLLALNALLPILADKACISILAYRGHPGGAQEASAIADYCQALDSQQYNISSETVTHTDNIPPILYFIRNFQH